jgi:hypothetical protein
MLITISIKISDKVHSDQVGLNDIQSVTEEFFSTKSPS